jgi:nucleotide-binding universal stress UspA family protein
MYRHILVATDGSELSGRAIRQGVSLAKALHARLTAIAVIAPYTPGNTAIASLRGFSAAVGKEARRALASFNAEARAQGVMASATTVVGGEPWKAILRTARSRKCDLVVMASHGRSGIAGVLLGSETARLLTHCKVPVLVCR